MLHNKLSYCYNTQQCCDAAARTISFRWRTRLVVAAAATGWPWINATAEAIYTLWTERSHSVTIYWRRHVPLHRWYNDRR